MVGIFSRFSRTGHRRSQSALHDYLISWLLILPSLILLEVILRPCSSALVVDHLKRCLALLDERRVVQPNVETLVASDAAVSHGIEAAVEFKPVEHPIEPLDNDQPVRCPLPEPSILNDGRIWKERLSANVRRSIDLPVVKAGAHLETEATRTKARVSPVKRSALPSSVSAPEHNILNLLEECKAAGD